MAGYNIKVQNMVVENGQVMSIGLSGGIQELLQMAIGEVETAQAGVKHMQRPLERKFTSIIAKLKALQLDLKNHEQYVDDLEARKQTRHQNTLCRQFVNMTHGKRLAGILGNLQENWSQDPEIMEGR